MERECSRIVHMTSFLTFDTLLGLQGHAIKNQDLLIASGTITSKGSEGLTAVDEDVQAAVSMQYSHRLVHVKSPHVTASTDPRH